MRLLATFVFLAAPLPFAAMATAQTASRTTLAASANPVITGAPETLTANVTPSSATGTVRFSVLGTTLATATLSGGSAALSVPTSGIAPGNYPVVATYLGSKAVAASASTPLAIAVAPLTATSTALSASANPVTVGSTETLTIKVTPAQGSSTAITGSVALLVDGEKLATATVTAGTAQLTVPTTGIAAGTYSAVALYQGAGTFAASTSAALSVAVQAAAPQGTPLSACADIVVSGSYYLTQDLTSPATCFFIDADNITLNLNGHTLTYGTGGGTASTPAFVLADSWYTAPGYDLAQTGSTDTHGGFVVYNGSVTAAANAAQRSTCFWVGQSNDITPAPVIHDLVLTTYAEDASPIFGTVSAPGWQIYNNTVNMASPLTSNRDYLWGYAIWIADDPNAGGSAADNIYNNKIIGAPQGGVFDDHQLANIHNNDIRFNSFFANDYCVANVSGNGQTITANTCHPASGRGIDVEAANTIVSNNTISVTELPQDAEYGGCEEGGADGIRVRDNAYQGNPASPVGVVVSGNTITANAATCQANGLRMTGLLAGDTVTLSGNTVTTTGAGTAAIPDYAISFDGTDGAATTFTANTLSSVYAWVNVDWDGAKATVNSGQTWQGTPVFALDDENGYYGTNPPAFAQSIVVSGQQSGAVNCGVSAAGPAQFGSTAKTCN